MTNNYENMLRYRNCNECSSKHIYFLRRIPLDHYPENVQNFVISMPQPAFYLDAVGKIFSMFRTLEKIEINETNRCSLELP